MMSLRKRKVRAKKMMDINLINTPKNVQTKTGGKQNKESGDSVSKFEDSLKETSMETSKVKSDSDDLEIGEPIFDESKEEEVNQFLKNIDALLSFLINNNRYKIEVDPKIIDNTDLNIEVIEGSDMLLNMEDTSLQSILIDIGISKDQIDTNNITYSDIIQKVVDNSETFKTSLKKEIGNFIQNDEKLDSLIGELDSVNILDNKEILINIKREIKNILNRSVGGDTQVVHDLNNGVNHLKNLDTISVMNNSHLMRAGDDNSVDALIDKISNNQDIDVNTNLQFNNILRDNVANIEEVIPTRTINRANFVNDFIEAIEYMSTNNKTEMIIKVNPEHLGKINIKYEVLSDKIILNLKIENRDVVKMVENVVHDIKSMIKETHNVNLENIYINLEQSNLGYNGQREGSHNKHNEDNVKINTPNIKIDEDDNNEDNADLKRGILV